MNSRIHIIEDERIVALDLKFKLEKLGYKITGMSASGEKALEEIEENKPDLVMMDIMLQGELDGIQTARQIRQKYKIPFIYLSALSDEATINRVKITEPYGYILKPFDIGDLKTNIEIALHKSQIEKKLIESELKYRSLFATARDAVITLNEDGVITSLNSKALEMFGYDYQEIINESIKNILPDIFVNHFSEGIKKFINIGKPVVDDIVELHAKRKNGNKFEIELSFSRWKTSEQFEYTLIIRDITDRKIQEAELKAAKENLEKRVEERTKELKSLIDQSTLPICVFDKEGFLLETNLEFSKIKNDVFNFENNKLLLTDLIKNAHYSEFINKLLQLGNSFTTKPLFYEKECSQNLDEDKIFIFKFYPINDDKGEITKAVCIIDDITKGIKAEETKQKLEWQKNHHKILLEKIEEERLRISRELHDEIGPMLFSSKLYLEALKKSEKINSHYLDDSTRLIAQGGNELKNIIQSLQPSVLNNYGFIPAVKHLLKDLENKNSIKAEFNFEVNQVRFKNVQTELNVYRIVQEALNNIKKHSQASKVKMDIFLNTDLLSFSIADNGRGFENNDIQVDDEYISFGLKNMRERTEILSGNFSIESEVDKGTTIIIDLPGELINAEN